jgi:predicted anti-sigma-YlaC factor YlaD
MTRDELHHQVFHRLAGNLTCKEMTEAATDYLEGMPGFWRRARFQMHLGLCLGCRIYLRQMKMAVRTMKSLPTEPPPPDMREELLQRFRFWKSACLLERRG